VGKLILFLILAFLLGLTFPESRSWMYETAKPALTPVLEWQSMNEMREIAREVSQYEQPRRGALPERREWPVFLEDEFVEETTVDAWGNTYQLRARRDSFYVVSPGVDGVMGTDDDLTTGRALSTAGSGRR
jgi:hypothetical protein